MVSVHFKWYIYIAILRVESCFSKVRPTDITITSTKQGWAGPGSLQLRFYHYRVSVIFYSDLSATTLQSVLHGACIVNRAKPIALHSEARLGLIQGRAAAWVTSKFVGIAGAIHGCFDHRVHFSFTLYPRGGILRGDIGA